MGRSNNHKSSQSDSKNWKLIIATLVPVWGFVMICRLVCHFSPRPDA